jgi:hypothetical protein
MTHTMYRSQVARLLFLVVAAHGALQIGELPLALRHLAA